MHTKTSWQLAYPCHQSNISSLASKGARARTKWIGTLKNCGSLSIDIINQTSHRSLEEELGLEEKSIYTKKKTNEKEKRKRKRKSK
jgi:hypothetical protein